MRSSNETSRVRAVADAVLGWSPAQPFFLRRSARSLVVLGYHAVDDPDRFAGQLDYLRRRTHPVSLDELVRALERRISLPERAVLITFDDADRTVLELGMPLLRDRGIPAVAFVVAGLLGGRRPVWTAEVRELVGAGAAAAGMPRLGPRDSARWLKGRGEAERGQLLEALRGSTAPVEVPQLDRGDLKVLESNGVAVGNHTFSHQPLPTCEQGRARAEVQDGHTVLEEALGHPPVALAFPEGAADPRVDGLLKHLGYRAAFLFDHAVSPFPPANPYRISRARVDAHAGLNRLRIVVSGLHPALHAARVRARQPASGHRSG